MAWSLSNRLTNRAPAIPRFVVVVPSVYCARHGGTSYVFRIPQVRTRLRNEAGPTSNHEFMATLRDALSHKKAFLIRV